MPVFGPCEHSREYIRYDNSIKVNSNSIFAVTLKNTASEFSRELRNTYNFVFFLMALEQTIVVASLTITMYRGYVFLQCMLDISLFEVEDSFQPIVFLSILGDIRISCTACNDSLHRTRDMARR